jgi:hypothetical protein
MQESTSEKSPDKKRLSQDEIKRIESGVKRAELLAKVLDDAYLDPIAGLWEGGGDAATAVVGLYIIYEAKKAGVPPFELAKMVGRTGLDFLAGSIPIVGDIFDFIYKSNKKNAEVLRKHFEKISQGGDLTEEEEEMLAESDRRRERDDLAGRRKEKADLKNSVDKKRKAA